MNLLDIYRISATIKLMEKFVQIGYKASGIREKFDIANSFGTVDLLNCSKLLKTAISNRW